MDVLMNNVNCRMKAFIKILIYYRVSTNPELYRLEKGEHYGKIVKKCGKLMQHLLVAAVRFFKIANV